MYLDGLKKITIGDLRDLFSVNELSIKEALPVIREFRNKHGLTDKEALAAFGLSKNLFDA